MKQCILSGPDVTAVAMASNCVSGGEAEDGDPTSFECDAVNGQGIAVPPDFPTVPHDCTYCSPHYRISQRLVTIVYRVVRK
jgi:hypothetical protein